LPPLKKIHLLAKRLRTSCRGINLTAQKNGFWSSFPLESTFSFFPVLNGAVALAKKSNAVPRLSVPIDAPQVPPQNGFD
jgi:hypothetical protein